MDTLLAILVGVLFSAGLYALLRPDLLRGVLGIVLVSNAVNLLVITAGRIGCGAPLVDEGASAPEAPFANPLPQALVLTAIVIGFGFLSFALVLVWRHFHETRSLRSDRAPATGQPPADRARREVERKAHDAAE